MHILQYEFVRLFLVIVSNFLQLYVFSVGLSSFLISFWGIKRRTGSLRESLPLNRFAIIIPAHNEAGVIAGAVDNLLALDYPKELFEVYVVADHCADETAEIARGRGAHVFVYDGDCPRGKSRALLALETVLLDSRRHDAFCYFDADSIAHPDFLKGMNFHLNSGEKVIQARELARNPDDSLITRVCHVNQLTQNYYGQMPKHRLGLSATLHGKGMCFASDIVRRFPWDPSAIAEDIEMQARLVRHGVHIHYAQEITIYDEEPSTINQMVHRSIRWTRGALYVANKHLAGLFLRATQRRDKCALEEFIRFSMCYRFVIIGFIALSMYVYRDSFSLLFWIFDHPPGARFSEKLINWVPVYLWPAYALTRERSSLRMYFTYLIMPWFYLALGIPISFVSIVTIRRKDYWYRTDHSCTTTISELTGEGGSGRAQA